MKARLARGLLLVAAALLACPALSQDRDVAQQRHRDACVAKGWVEAAFQIAGLRRTLFWKGPAEPWSRGAILVLHGGGGSAAHFCGDGWLVGPQIEFAEMALAAGFAVFALEATVDVVTDAAGDPCGKRFDSAGLDRPNVDLPYIEHIVRRFIPEARPPGSGEAIFVTGLSSGGYMTIRAAREFPDLIAAFAPVAAGDPRHTLQVCDESLSSRKVAKGIFLDRDSRIVITRDGACEAGIGDIPAEPATPTGPPFRQFHHRQDGIVDLSCMRKAERALAGDGFRNDGPFILDNGGRRRLLLHLWQSDYNAPLIEFFAGQT